MTRRKCAEIYRTGRGSVRLRARWRYLKEGNLIEIYEIPYTTTTEAIIDKVAELIKAGKIREISDMRDETDLSGLKLTIDLKRGVEPDKLMQKLFRSTPLQDSFACNFNILIAGMPRVMGVREIIEEWTAWRTECVRRRAVLPAAAKRAKSSTCCRACARSCWTSTRPSRIIRETESEAEVVPNLMIGFGIDEVQAEFVAEIKLRNINKEYILQAERRRSTRWQREIAELEKTLGSEKRIRRLIVQELDAVAAKYGTDRRTVIVEDAAELDPEPEEETPDYPVTIFVSREGYFKKITPQSLRMSGEQRFKEGDGLRFCAARRRMRRSCSSSRTAARSTRRAVPILTTARPRCSATICPRSSASTRARASRPSACPATTAAACSSCSPTVRRRAWSFPPIRRSPTAAS